MSDDPAERWPSAREWVRLTDSGVETWRSTDEHREDRGYAR